MGRRPRVRPGARPEPEPLLQLGHRTQIVALALTCGACEPRGPLQIAVNLPYDYDLSDAAEPIERGIRMALHDAGGRVGEHDVELVEYDSTISDSYVQDFSVEERDEYAREIANEIVAEKRFLAVIGESRKSVDLPITNEAGLLECGPIADDPGLTLPEFGANDLRPRPENNFVRVIGLSSNLVPAMAVWTWRDLGVSEVYVLDDDYVGNIAMADDFQTRFLDEGGTIVGRGRIPYGSPDIPEIIAAAAETDPGGLVLFSSYRYDVAEALHATADAGIDDVPVVGLPALTAGSGLFSESTLLELAGDDAEGTWAVLTIASQYPGQADFEPRYEWWYGEDEYMVLAAHGYACAQVALDAIGRALATEPRDWASLRAEVRAAAVDPTYEYDTLLGTFHFDDNGDPSQQIVSVVQADVATLEWVFADQFDFAAVP